MKNCVLITGATGGLGRSYVYEFAKRGFDLVLSATKQSRLEELKSEILKEYPNIKIYAKECNLAFEESRAELFKFLDENNIKINALVNNAGYMFEGSFEGCELEEILSCVKVNVEGTLDLTHRFLRRREKTEKNYILIVSSSAAFYPMPQMATYSATKVLLTTMVKALRSEYKGKNVNILSVNPGSMATNDKMKASIKSQGLGGKLSLQETDKVARVSVKKLFKNKCMYVPGFFNKLTHLLAVITPTGISTAYVKRRWTKCEKKRGCYR